MPKKIPGIPAKYPLQTYIKLEQSSTDAIKSILRKSLEEVDRKLALVSPRDASVSDRLSYLQLRSQRAAINTQLMTDWKNIEKAIAKGAQDAAIEASAVMTRYEATLLDLVMDKSAVSQYAASEAKRATSGLDSLVQRLTGSKLPLSQRVYKSSQVSKGYVDDAINRALVQGLSAAEFAKSIRDLIDPAVPGGVSYAALRAARTEINNAFHASTIKRAQDSGIVDEMDWNLSSSHPEGDECDSFASESPYPIKSIPRKPHPMCLCFLTPALPDKATFLAKLKNGDYGDEPWSSNATLPPAPAPVISSKAPTPAVKTAVPAATKATLNTPLMDALPRYAPGTGPKSLAEFQYDTGVDWMGKFTPKKFVNPKNDNRILDYQINCSRVATAMELRVRGIKAVAGPKPENLRDNGISVIANTWRTKTGGKRDFKQHVQSSLGTKSSEEIATEAMAKAPEGARFFVVANWKKGGAHIWNAEVSVVNGKKVVNHYEGQVEQKMDLANNYFKKTQSEAGIWIMRVDDMVPTDALVKPAKAPKAPKPVTYDPKTNTFKNLPKPTNAPLNQWILPGDD